MMVWFRMSMNYGSQPVFKPYEMQAAFHPERYVRSAFTSDVCVSIFSMFDILEC